MRIGKQSFFYKSTLNLFGGLVPSDAMLGGLGECNCSPADSRFIR